ncbi:helix-turn-helix transcriptional regulator [Sulfurospirillum halorespirans]|uniref:Transcriptional regulator, HTH-type n=1 Tax=Sulfurospirillum halorespirans DSM 13726 TaxID=1193502 RepID=A0A1D7TK99_9BACT|nr:YafY family protein [Sulfurospirillum halorespirans]AOO65429.1 transcriptional regulator, HTH-type [Sulfurospirillum halorespirans DSM 13726]
MQINRLFEIVYILLDKKTVTANELSEHFEVSIRTIYRDVNTLSSAGIPIYASRGKGGGIGITDGYVLNKSVLSDKEQNEILYALQSLSITHHLEDDKVLSRLSGLFKKNGLNWIEVDFSPWGSTKNQISQFTTLKDAILGNLIIEFDYINGFGEKSRRKIEPIKLVYKVNAWYLYGFCLSKNCYRTFKISRITKICVTQDGFTKRAEQTNEEPQDNGHEQWITIKLKISKDGAYRAYEEFNEESISKNEDGSLMIETVLPDNKWLMRYLLSFGDDLEVVEPQHIRDELYHQSEKIFKKYQRKFIT